MIIVYVCHDIMNQKMKSRFRVEELGRQLGLPTEQIQTILNNTKQETENLSFSVGPPWYCGAYYGTISINDFNISKKK
jgi:hypothetical protein